MVVKFLICGVANLNEILIRILEIANIHNVFCRQYLY